jgi:hypothetical protein
MTNRIDLSGQRFGRLTVVAESDPYIGPSGKKARRWRCKCDCGNTATPVQSNLKSGIAKSCGCLRVDRLIERSTSHGNAARANPSPEYRAWSAINRRCSDTNHSRYADYGGRGIQVLWKSFDEFLKAMGKQPSAGHSIDRVDVNGHYCTENCRWASPKEQSRNKRDTQWVEWNGRRQSLADWADETGISHSTLYHRLVKQNWPIEQALTTKPISEPKQPRLILWNGREQRLSEWARELGIDYKILANRIYRRGWTIEKAFTDPVLSPGKHLKRALNG